ncbi:MAG TPA: alpha-L-fucosidase [Terriglobia bacterium]|nr:alpha-L-fucosidase [Terriglobia bacterium]
MNRRTFNKLIALGSVEASTSALAKNEGAFTAPVADHPTEWPAEVYRRFSIDTHVPDWDPQLLSRFDAAEYVGNIARGGLQTMMQYTNSHVGLCLWRTKVGRMHANMKGRDYFGEVVDQCRRQGLHPLAYFSVIFDNWNFEQHPDWRILGAEGNNARLEGRYGVVCPNSPYREYVKACIQEIVGNYDIEGIFFDMTFWPDVCYCPHCTARFWREHHTEPPRVVDWDDPTWRAFQKARQQWLLEFAHMATDTVKKIRPITVNHQYSTIFHNWTLGVPLELTDACDYVGGDFYGGPAQQSLVCKTYYGLTRSHPFEFHTSRTHDPTDHVMMKPADELRTESFVATLHSAGLLLVDYINADGTLNPQVYDALKSLNEQRAVYEPFLGGELLADVAIYYDKNSMYNPDEKGVHITKLKAVDTCPHRDAVVGTARILRNGHLPYGVVTNANLEQLRNYRAAILPNVLELTSEQAEQFRRFVEDGGVLYASGPTSLDRGNKNGLRFLLEDVLGVRYKGLVGNRRINYLTPKEAGLTQAVWPQDHVSFPGPMIQAEALPGTEVLATVTLPFVDPGLGHVIGSHFAAIHSNPPALAPGMDPAVVVHRFGRGRTVWIAAPMESRAEAVNTQLTLYLLRQVLAAPFWFELDAHPAIEMTLFNQAAAKRLLASLLNVQQQMPPIPLEATVRVKLPSGRAPIKVLRAPDRKPIDFKKDGPCIQFKVEPFDVFSMTLVEYV